MSKKTLYIMCGPAGSGKSTWATGHSDPAVSAVISRDKIRFSMVNVEDEYFSKETEVYNLFCKQIAEALDSGYVNVFADATHLTRAARTKLLNKVFPTPLGLEHTDVDIIPVVICPSLETTLAQNAQREGRERVPEAAIRNMYRSFQEPELKEGKYTYASIIKEVN